MTYLEMVNNILVRLRERTVSSVSENSYSRLIGQLVNDAKKEVEDSWGWSSLRTTLTATTTAGTFSYSLTGAGRRFSVLEVFDDTNNRFLHYKDAQTITQYYLTSPDDGDPIYYNWNGVDSNGDAVVDFYPKPDSSVVIRFNIIERQDDLTLDGETVWIPEQPVLLLAYAKAIEERGEDGGVGASSAYMAAQRSLADAVSLDAARHPEDLLWSEV